MRNETNSNPQTKTRAMKLRRWCALSVAFAGVLFYGYMAATSNAGVESEGVSAEEFAPEIEDQDTDYSRFKHSNPMHNRLPCLLCHKRNDNSPTPRLSGHQPCSGCHAQQFADNQHPICTICHTATSVKRFPALRSFNARFDHAKHLRQADCMTCHKPSRRGVGFSIPSGSNAHTSCFQCHTANSSNEMASCGLCHQPGSPSRTSDWAKAYTVNFSHAKHLQNQNCAACHTVRAGMPRGRQVTAPLVSMHFAPGNTQSCAGCHNNRRTFGGDDFSDCKRCHTGNTFRFR